MDVSKVFTLDVTISGGGLPVRADVRSASGGSPRPVIVVSPGFLAYRKWGFFPWISERLAIAGYHVVTLTFSHSGTDDETGMIVRPGEFAANTVSIELSDLQRVLRWTVSSGFPLPASAARGLLGHSRGGSVSILAAGSFPQVRSIVTWATPSRLDRYTGRRKDEWKRTGALEFSDSRSPVPLRLDYSYYEDIDANREKFDLPAAAAALEIPHLVVHGERDAAVSVSEADGFFLEPSSGVKRLEVLKGCGHTFGAAHPMSGPSPALEKAAALTVEWFTSTMPAL